MCFIKETSLNPCQCFAVHAAFITSNNVTGYGPRVQPIFEGDERKYEILEGKFLRYLQLKKLRETIHTPLAESAGAEATDENKNADAFSELILCLNNRNLSLAMSDVRNDCGKALIILRGHYRSKGKPKIISLYTELTTLRTTSEENVCDYSEIAHHSELLSNVGTW